MSDEIKITDPNNCPIVYATQVLGQGSLNAVVNITLGVPRFTPDAAGKVDVDMIVAARLRLDIPCAVQLRDNLDEMLKKILPKVEGTIQ